MKGAPDRFFDTPRDDGVHAKAEAWMAAARVRKLNLRRIDPQSIGIALDEATSAAEVDSILAVFNEGRAPAFTCADLARDASPALAGLERKSAYLTHPVFNTHHSETEMMRYLRLLESRDLSLTRSMIALGSCTMKLNA